MVSKLLCRIFMFLAVIICGTYSEAKIDVLFHPIDPTLNRIADLILQKPSQIQIAMYNIDTTEKNPVVAALMDSEIQKLIQQKKMQVVMIFEGYGTPEENNQKMSEIEALGVDVRSLKSGKKVHHKYALFHFHGQNPVLVTGSANWSLTSFKNYNENILFIEDEDQLIRKFSSEFQLLWNNSEEFGQTFEHQLIFFSQIEDTQSTSAWFTSNNFLFNNGQVKANNKSEGYTITREIVKSIDQARHSLKIATTRLKLRPIYEALLRAAQRGVKIQLVVSMDEYERNHAKLEVPDCSDSYAKACSSGVSFTSFLDRDYFEGHENIEVRIKFYSLHLASYITYQMHNKYMVVDDQKVLTGSFNWSYSSEYEHIENIVSFDRSSNTDQAVDLFLRNFDMIWDLNRNNYSDLIESYQNQSTVKCSFAPMTLKIFEIDQLIKTAGRKKCQ